MNGFLDSLAARALAPTTAPLPPGAVRPQVRARFEPEPASVLGMLPAIEESIEHSWAPDAPTPAARAASPIAVRAEPNPERHQLPAVAEAPRVAHLDRSAATTTAPAPTAHLTTAPPISPALPSVQPAPQLVSSALPVEASPVPPTPSAPRLQPPPDTHETHRRAVADVPRPEPGAVSKATAPVPSQPTAAIPTAPPGTLQPAPIAARVATGELAEPPRARQSERGRDGPNSKQERAAVKQPSGHTVHVSIGRIEIRASAPTRAPARQERASPQPLGLDDYLRQHARGDKP